MKKDEEIKLLIFVDNSISEHLSMSPRELTGKYKNLSSTNPHKTCLDFKIGYNDIFVHN